MKGVENFFTGNSDQEMGGRLASKRMAYRQRVKHILVHVSKQSITLSTQVIRIHVYFSVSCELISLVGLESFDLNSKQIAQ